MKKVIQTLCVLFALFMLYLGYIFWSDLDSALIESNHTIDNLGKVLAGRFIVSALLALFAAWYFDLKVLTVVFILFAIMGLIDGFTYYSQGLPHIGHTITGTVCLLIAGAIYFYRKKNNAMDN